MITSKIPSDVVRWVGHWYRVSECDTYRTHSTGNPAWLNMFKLGTSLSSHSKHKAFLMHQMWSICVSKAWNSETLHETLHVSKAWKEMRWRKFNLCSLKLVHNYRACHIFSLQYNQQESGIGSGYIMYSISLFNQGGLPVHKANILGVVCQNVMRTKYCPELPGWPFLW